MDGRRQGIPRASQNSPNSRQNRGRYGTHPVFAASYDQFHQGRQPTTSNFPNGNNAGYNRYNPMRQSSGIYRGNASSHQSHQERQSTSNSTNRNNQGHNSRYQSTGASSRGRNSRNTPYSTQKREKRPIGFKALESLLEKDAEELILELSNSNRGIIEVVQTKLTEDTIILFIRILKKVLDSSFEETKYKVLQIYLDDAFVDKLIKYIIYLPMQNKEMKRNNQYFWNNPDEFWYNMVGICEFINDTIPTFGRKVLPEILKSLQVCFPSFEDQHQFHISDEIKEKVKRLNEAVQTQVKEYEESQKVNAKNMMKEDKEEEPPDDFRQISVYPSSLELAADAKAFVRKNVVKGPYKDVNHYLDIQFRLLREDFVGPLRAGIMAYQLRDEKGDRRKRVENVRIHPRVQFLHPETANEQYCIRLRFDFSKKKKDFKYENSKRFIYGSLLCFTPDDFRSIIFGKVANRDVADLQKGEFIVGFDQNVTVQYNVNYLMVECSVFFEPYYHVLNVLQNMSVDNFPMEKYIIRADSSVQPPEYLRTGCSYTIQRRQFSPLINWPNVNFYGFNDSQRAAFRAALTQEFSIIQGPPGTGKTFLGLKIAKTLLENQNVWYKKTPILVICYTNHALDQFLEGLTQFTDRILRVGGQSKNENLKSFNLKNQTRYKLSPAVYQQKSVVRVTLAKIQNVSENLKQIEFYHSIRSFRVFEDIVPNFNESWFARAKAEEILNWLLGEKEASMLQTAAISADIRQISAALRDVQLANAYQPELEESEESDSEDDEFNEDVEIQIDNLFDDVKVMATQCSTPLVTLSALRKNIEDLEHRVAVLKQIEAPTTGQRLEEEKCKLELWELRSRYHYLNAKLVEGKQKSSLEKTPPAFIDLKKPHNMSPKDRWALYFYWLDLYKQQLRRKLDLLNDEFRESFKIYEEMRDIENSNAMKSVLVVGMTTTGAARLRSSLQALRSPVVIVEEAAEVLEAHIIAALTKHCQHLILIGDHQQLKPSTANYRIERFYSLGISLFERMVINQIQLFTLNVQHRMRPEISSLITPTIYPNLEDHPSVKDRPQIKGVDNCLYFLDHTNPEADCDGTSKKNYHEVEFLINFAKHLILNGYKPEQITILAAYLGQMFEMQKQKKKHRHVLENIRIAVLDNYQGEECDIILLSLVRNNEHNKIGFLSIENRVCVALSRARNGFFLMGNMTQLCSETLWQKIRRTLEQQNAIGTELALRCQVHTDKVTYVKNGEDFLKIPEGGCDQKCGADLVCGHKCTVCCHILDRDHLEYRCRETCNKRLCNENSFHLCKDMCYKKCRPCYYSVPRSLKCGHTVNLECHIDPDAHNCTVPVTTTLPCGHIADKPCHRDAQTYRCPHPCEVKVEPCGHACAMNCHIRLDPDHLEYKCRKKCAQYRKGCTVKTDAHLCPKACYEECDPCRILVKKERSVCPHWYDVECSSNVDDIVCEKPCTKILPCSHKCKSKCHEPCGKCEKQVEKIAPCGHIVKVKCCEEPNQKLCNRKCPRKLSCGHNCTKNCNQPCTTQCKESVQCALMAPCGHTITQIECWVTNSSSAQDSKILLQYCNNPCPSKLECDHMCSGSCGECYQGRVHKPCAEKCGFPLVCNHPCQFPCRQACRPCTLPCPYKCKHSSCGKRCGDVCTPCKEKCARSCRHQKCTRFCGDFCDVPPCTRPCEKLLKCGHPCVGFCGDSCPPKCLICDKDELTTIFFGGEDEEGARFVLLNDCGHILESEGLEAWMKQDDNAIAFKVCPMCKTPIKTTQRYTDLIKVALADVAKVKQKFYGESREIDSKKGHLLLKLVVLKQKSANISIHWGCPELVATFATLLARLQRDRKGRRQPINKSELGAVESKLQIIEHIVDICTEANTARAVPVSKVNNTSAEHEVYVPQVKFLLNILNRDENSITNQEIADIQLELNRLSRLVEYSKVMKSPNFNAVRNNSQVKNIVDKVTKIFFGVGRFYDTKEENVMQLLKELSKLCSSGIGISEKERREIVAAIGLKQGHWYKCPNGHPYAIGECGGAMQRSKCPECGAIIGGTSHNLAAGNSVASEMDGASFAAWSDAANMANYQL